METSVLQLELEPPGNQFPSLSPAGKYALSLDVCEAGMCLKAISS